MRLCRMLQPALSTRSLVAVILLLSPPGDELLEGLRWSHLNGGGLGFVSVLAQVEKCHPKCSNCHLFDYDLSWHCLECQPGYDLWVDGCFLPCPAGEYRYGYKCEKCFPNCQQCVGGLAHECQVCGPGFEFDFRNLCNRVCNPGKYATVDGLTCNDCDPYCKTCNAESRIACQSCYQGYTLRVLDPNTQTGECMQDCRKGFFRDAPNDLRCIQCGKYCDDCNSLYNCFECQPGATLYRGICYLVPTENINQEIDFESYLNSGAGIAWDDSDAPDWMFLTTEVNQVQGMSVPEERRMEEATLQDDLLRFDPMSPRSWST
eukprot:TRINITY_DN111991_c0_g1_i1.p1 TRINITY_DN111991_c0_g1~~TRINITY_DN111991_c0_g1_i1.p1  ORF type:complete len:340 (-),score=50.23 TRINITY_DN111991_c0_g1_i1:64-1017(-)